jgi:hypothetical protein
MELPFTRQEFFQIFSEYNRALWPMQFLAACIGILAIALLLSRRQLANRLIAGILALLMFVNGIGYHWLFFSRINTAAIFFGAMFLIGGSTFLIEGTIRNRVQFTFGRNYRSRVAALLIIYALVIYPALGLLLHPYPESPLFGVVPCPTIIFVLGFLILAAHPRPAYLVAVPLIWAAIGGTAAILLDVPQDWGLLAAAGGWICAPSMRSTE